MCILSLVKACISCIAVKSLLPAAISMVQQALIVQRHVLCSTSYQTIVFACVREIRQLRWHIRRSPQSQMSL